VHDAREQSKLVAVEEMRKHQNAHLARIPGHVQAHALPVEDGDVDRGAAQSTQKPAERTRHLSRVTAGRNQAPDPHQASLRKMARPLCRPLRRTVRAFEKSHIENVLKETDGDRTQTAELLGLSRSSLYRKLEALGIES
jgi:DNA-binding NtrC family response regulator